MRRLVKRAFGLALCLVMALSLVTAASAAQASTSNNAGKQQYTGNWDDPVNSYLFENSTGGLTRVEYIGGRIIVEDYDSSFQCQSSLTIPMELSIWGGFFAGEDYNFFIFGQENPQESSSVEVVRVVKYDKNWNRLGAASLYGADSNKWYGAFTRKPFHAASLRCAEGSGYLYVRTSHEMYTSADGKNHQASLMLSIRESDMTFNTVGNQAYNNEPETDAGYVSHCFNQFILADQQNRVVSLDHGDAYPRGLIVQVYGQAGSENFDTTHTEPQRATLVTFPGATGDNKTGCSAGGFAETSNGYVAVYSYDGMGASRSRELYVDFVSKDGLSVSNTAKMSVNCYNFTPALASTGLDGGYVLWQEDAGYQSDLLGIKLYYARYDANGSVGQVQTAAGALSDCAPIYWNGKVVWYATKSSTPVFYTLDDSGVTAYAADGAGQLPSTTPSTPATPSTPFATSTGVAYANTQTILLDGRSVTLDTYALKDSAGNLTNYVKLRDMAWYLNGTKAQFSVGWDQDCIYLTTHWRYEANGSELSTPFSGDRPYRAGTGRVKIDLIEQNLSSIVLTDDRGGDYTYFKLRDLGHYLDFNVSYINGRVVVNSNESYSDAQ